MTGGKPIFYRSQAVSESGGRASFEKQVTLLLETKPPCFTNRPGLFLRLLKPRTAHVTPYGLPLLKTRGPATVSLPLGLRVLGLRVPPRASALQRACAGGEAGRTGWFAASP